MNNFNQPRLKHFSARFIFAALAVFVAFLAMSIQPRATLAGEAVFLSVIDDLPLMEGLSESGDGVQFESPQGRIAEVSATGNVKPQTLSDFYENALPQLGWKKISSGTYLREGEILKITTGLPEDGSLSNGALVVIFSLHPQKGG
ncbi:MAG: hypothetical protein OEW37_00860 [Rhodospirillaceae bacterium]|nr:hypothetical protein [Rhodospirillaceae bacterium]